MVPSQFSYFHKLEDDHRTEFAPYLKLMVYRANSEEPDVYHSNILQSKVN